MRGRVGCVLQWGAGKGWGQKGSNQGCLVLFGADRVTAFPTQHVHCQRADPASENTVTDSNLEHAISLFCPVPESPEISRSIEIWTKATLLFPTL